VSGMLVEILQTFGRVVLAILSGAMIIFGTAFLADILGGPKKDTFQAVSEMLNDPQYRIISLTIAGVTAYVIGIVNVAGSSILFDRLVRKRKDDLLIISQFESLKQPQVLKEALDLLNVKRTLIAFMIPLIWYGTTSAFDPKQWRDSPLVPKITGSVIAIAGVLAFYLAARMGPHLEVTLQVLLASRTPKPDLGDDITD
jgi:hypothetical protein